MTDFLITPITLNYHTKSALLTTYLECFQELPLLDDDFDAGGHQDEQTGMIVHQIQKDDDGRRASV